MTSLIERIGLQALKTFSNRTASPHKFEQNFKELKVMTSQITAADVNLNIDVLKNVTNDERHPPVTYIDIYEDPFVTIGIFVLQAGARLPLHDHPHMYGILKVIAGTVKIQSYTIVSKNQNSPRREGNLVFSAIKVPEVILNEQSDASSLTPVECNLHEIHSVGEAAAFLDILSPPYDKSDIGSRSCHYFREHSNSTNIGKDSNLTSLINIPSPPEYWSNTAAYEGPRLRKTY